MGKLWKRAVVVVLTAGGLVTAAATAADALIASNHCEP